MPARKPKPAQTHIRSLARAYTDQAIATISALMKNSQDERVRLAAAMALVSIGWGKPMPQQRSPEDREELQLVIRRIVVEEHQPAPQVLDLQANGRGNGHGNGNGQG